MLESLRQVLARPLTIIGVVCMLVLVFAHEPTSMYYYLTIAQLVYVPVVLQQIVTLHKWQVLMIFAGQLAVTTLFFVDNDVFAVVAASIYIVSTLAIMWSGVERFLRRGFVNTAEIMIDIGLIYIAIGGIWFYAHVVGIDTGFSPIITWLTAIHFHYSAFLLCITVGLLGRLRMTRFYAFCCAVIAVGPILVALGITFSHIIEIISVCLYVVAIFSQCIYAMKAKLPLVAGLFIRLAFLTLCFTIIWSFLYAYSNLTGSGMVSIPNMLDFHGVLNCILFGGAIVTAWTLYIPATQQPQFTFPVSQIRGKLIATAEPHHALVDDMSIYIDKSSVNPSICHFYESTQDYELKASVKWAIWFKPIAYVYQFISRRIEQLNLPYSADTVIMSGHISKVDATLDGRDNPRVWQRYMNDKTVFKAIYSQHVHDNQRYMNIALPLPYSSMHGILELTGRDGKLYLTSDSSGDAGTYLAIGRYTLKLPLHEYFCIWEEQNHLHATHDMTLFGIKFLHINYWIKRK